MSQPRSPAPPPDIEGFTFVKLLGSGGFSDVFLYEREFPRQKVAVKVLVPDAVDDETRRRFTDEANVMASLSTHPYIVSVYEARITDDGRPYLVMEHYPRPNFHVRARSERFTVPAVLRAGIQIAAAVETAHRAGVLHRDIKPSNILTSEYGRPGLTDFGIAVAGDAEPVEAEGMSIPWSPPEIVAGSGQGDVRADVYSLGATLWTLLAGGRSPFEAVGGENRNIDLIDRIDRGNVAPVDRADVPDSLQRLLSQAMSKEPRGRPSSAAELARSLQVIEVEQRFDMTSFEISEDTTDAPAPTGEQVDVDAGATRVKGLDVIESQAERRRRPRARARDRAFDPDSEMITSAPVGRDRGSDPGRDPVGTDPEIIASTPLRDRGSVPPPAAPPGRGRPAPGQGDVPVVRADERAEIAFTAPRVAADRSDGPPEAGATPSGTGRRWFLVVVAVAVSAAVVTAGALLLGMRNGGEETSSPTTEQVDERPPAVDDVRVEELGGGQFEVRWTLPDGLVATDEIRVEGLDVDSGALAPSTTRWEFRSAAGRHCPTVTVVRDGRASEAARPGGCS